MDGNLKFSVIIPVYNVEKYLKECVESVLKQSYLNYEVILVDDGSTDSSGAICDSYSKTYKEVSVIHKKNGGLSDARNAGLDVAQGEYIVFVDSDDWIEPDALNNFNQCLDNTEVTKPDIIITRMTENYMSNNSEKTNDECFYEYLHEEVFTKERAIRWQCCKTQDTWPAPKSVYSREFIESNALRFAVGRLHEDLDWTSKCMVYASSFIGMTDSWYHHRMDRVGSITNTVKGKAITDVIEMGDSFFRNFYIKNDWLTELILQRILKTVYPCIKQSNSCSENDKQCVSTKIKEKMEFLGMTKESKYKIFFMAIKICGFQNAMRLLQII